MTEKAKRHGGCPTHPVITEDCEYYGLSRRELFAAMAMQGLLSGKEAMKNEDTEEVTDMTPRIYAKAALICADALLEALTEEVK